MKQFAYEGSNGLQRIILHLKISKKAMGWYQSERERSEWTNFLNKRPINVVQLLSHDQFLQYINKADSETLSFIQTNYKAILTELLTFVLVLPGNIDSFARKYQYPKQSIALLELLFETTSTPNTNLASSITSSTMLTNTMCKVGNLEIVSWMVGEMVDMLGRNKEDELENTLIPGYFGQLFGFLLRSHGDTLVNTLKGGKGFEQIVKRYGKYQQIMGCLGGVLNVAMSFSTNVQLSITTSLPRCSNYPWYLKYQLLQSLLSKLSSSTTPSLIKCNILSLLSESLKSSPQIYDGTMIADELCQMKNVNIYWSLVKENNAEEYEHELKAVDMLKWVVKAISKEGRQVMIDIFKQLCQLIMKGRKMGIRFVALLDLMTEWLYAESSGVCLLTSESMQSSMHRSVQSSMIVNPPTAALSLQYQNVMTEHLFFCHLLNLCYEHSANNIFHKRVEKLFSVVFRMQNSIIIDHIYRENNIIHESIKQLNTMKKRPGYWGPIINIIEIFSKRRIDTEVVIEAIKKNDHEWNQVYQGYLQPYARKLNGRLGEMGHGDPENPTEFTVNKKFKKRQDKKDPAILRSPELQKAKMPFKQEKQPPKNNPEPEENPEPIKINILQPVKNEGQEQKNESFESFMKRKMAQNSINLKQKRKTRTPSKIKAASLKKNRWEAEEEEKEKKSISSNARIEKKQKTEAPIEKPKPIKLYMINKQNYPPKIRERKITTERDSRLVQWMKLLPQKNQ